MKLIYEIFPGDCVVRNCLQNQTCIPFVQVLTHHGVPTPIAEIIKRKYPRAWPIWGDVPRELRNIWFNVGMAIKPVPV